MPIVSQLSRAEVSEDLQGLYDRIFGAGRDPVADPGTSTGTPGDFWTTWAHAPDALMFFRKYSYNDAPLETAFRSLVLARTGYVRESRFVYSQHCKSARAAGVPEEKIAGIPAWQIKDCYTPRERAAFAYIDALALQHGRVHDDVFEALRAEFNNEELLNLTYFINLYILHATTARSLKLEYDNIPERVVEVPYPAKPVTA